VPSGLVSVTAGVPLTENVVEVSVESTGTL